MADEKEEKGTLLDAAQRQMAEAAARAAVDRTVTVLAREARRALETVASALGPATGRAEGDAERTPPEGARPPPEAGEEEGREAALRRGGREGVAERISGFADETLSSLERAVFGDKKAVEDAEKDPLERARARFGFAENAPAEETVAETAPVEPAKPAPPTMTAREAAEAKAREQLAELKRKMGKA